MKKCQACCEQFHAEASSAMATQMPRAIEVHSKLAKGCHELSKQDVAERAEQDKMNNEELAQLQEQTDKFLAANVEPTHPRFAQHLVTVKDIELRKESLIAQGCKLKPLMEACEKVTQRIQASTQLEPSKKRRRLWMPLLGRLGGS